MIGCSATDRTVVCIVAVYMICQVTNGLFQKSMSTLLQNYWSPKNAAPRELALIPI